MNLDELPVAPVDAAAAAALDRAAAAKRLAVPTDDAQVRRALRAHGQPVTLFGEGPAERRDRLRELLAVNEAAGGSATDDSDAEMGDSDDGDEFYTLGPPELLEARVALAQSSLAAAGRRLARERARAAIPAAAVQRLRQAFFSELRTLEAVGAEAGDTRPLSYVRFSPDSLHMATAGFGGAVQVWKTEGCVRERVWAASEDVRVCGVEWHPDAGSAASLVTCALDGQVVLWDTSGKQMSKLEGHSQRVCRAKFHPFGRHVATTSNDGTWRLFDAETSQELLLQEGHDAGVFALGLHGDGSLVATGGYDAYGRLWDLRSGRAVMLLHGHAAAVLAADFSPGGRLLATGSADNAVHLWDLRRADSAYTLPAHSGPVVECRFWHAAASWAGPPGTESPENARLALDGSVLVTCGFDGACRLWTERDWRPLAAVHGAERRVMSCDVSGDGRWVATASYDRSLKLYSRQSSALTLAAADVPFAPDASLGADEPLDL